MIFAKVLADSVGKEAPRLTTLHLYLPKILDAEFEKHRAISSSSSSDRAIPVARSMQNPPWIPTDVRVAGPGMQQAEQVDPDTLAKFQTAFLHHYHQTVDLVDFYADRVHKQHLNRLFIPYAMQHKIATVDEDGWKYFLRLRESEDADPAIQILAREIRKALDASTPKFLDPGEWHLPFIKPEEEESYLTVTLLRLSAARCARVSYARHDGSDPDIDRDLERANLLQEKEHWTPFEHQATPNTCTQLDLHYKYTYPLLPLPDGTTHISIDGWLWSGNFKGWIQHRKLIDG
jgi:thymidylate synthase ThyX